MTIDRTGAGRPLSADDDTAEVLCRLDLPAYIAQVYPTCKMTGKGGSRRCLAAWRGGDGDNVTIYKQDEKWKWTDHAQGEGGDALDFLQNVEGLGKQAAWDKARAIAGVERVVPRARQRGRVTGEWFYTDEAGVMVSRVRRVEPGKVRPKDYPQDRPDGNGGWLTGLGDVRRDLVYRLPEVMGADLVYVVEGEKCADRLRADGLVATCNPGGAGKWTREHARHLAGKHVVVLGDNDEPGRKHVKQVVRTLQGVAASIKVPELEGLQPKGDVYDWLEAGSTIADLRALVDATPEANEVQADAATEGDLDDDRGPAWEGRPSRSGGMGATLADVSTALHALQGTVGTIYLETFSGRLLVEPGPLLQGGDTRGFTDLDALQITRYLQGAHDMRRASKDKVLDAAQLVGYDNRRNALSDWLDSLAWDGVERLGAWLVSAYGVDDTEYTRCVGWNWLLSMVARAYRPGCKVDTMPVLEGEQGLGKSDSLRALVGALGAQGGTPREHRFVDTRFEPDNKDFLLTVRGRWLVEIAELHGLQKSDREAIKQFLSRQVDAVRVPYDRVVLDTPRTCVMVGTTNETEYLSDPTGARRFWPLSCKHVDLAWIEANRDQLWAEAVVKYKAGGKWWYMPDEAQVEQEARSTTHPWAGPILRWLNEPGQKGRAKFEAHTILEGALGLTWDRQSPATSRQLSDLLKRHKWEHRRDRPGTVPRLHWWHRPQG